MLDRNLSPDRASYFFTFFGSQMFFFLDETAPQSLQRQSPGCALRLGLSLLHPTPLALGTPDDAAGRLHPSTLPVRFGGNKRAEFNQIGIPVARPNRRLHWKAFSYQVNSILSRRTPQGHAPVPTASAPLVKLERTIHARAKKPNAKSYTSQLLSGGVPKIGAKIVEEAAEVVEAAGEPGDAGRQHFIREVGDLVYHLLVMMCHRDCDLGDVEAELARRFGVSGLEEKASRNNQPVAPPESEVVATTAAKPAKKAAKKKVAKAAATSPVKKKTRRKSRL